MKKSVTALTALLLLLSLVLCGCAGNISDVERVVSESAYYTEDEINSAMDAALAYFKKEFKGCKMLNIHYNEEAVLGELELDARQYDADEAIVLVSEFTTGKNVDIMLNPESTYANWKWILIRTGGGPWTVRSWGYV